MRKTLKIAGITILSIVAILAIGIAILAVNSSGKLQPLQDAQGDTISGAIAEKSFVEIGGMRQGLFIRGENPQNPVILFLHGGPGSPELPFTLPCERAERLEKYFTVCYWDQRAAGMSWSGKITPSDVTIDHYVEDTRAMTDYLRERFGVDKIVLMGHSWGSYLGVKTIQKYPSLYDAYIGIGQVTDQRQSEKIAYDWMLEHARKIGDTKAVERLTKFDRTAAEFPTIDYIVSMARTPLMNKYGIGISHAPVSMLKTVGEMLLFGGYTLREKWGYLRGMVLSSQHAFPQVLDDNLFETATRFEIPVYVMQGRFDYQVSQTLARQWMDAVEAPAKGFFEFDNSAHSPNIEQSEKFVAAVREVVAGTL